MPVKVSWSTCLKIGISAFALYLCIHFWPAVVTLLGGVLRAATPLLVGCVIAYALNILMVAYEKRFFPKSEKKGVKRIRRPLCVLLAILSLVAIIAVVIWLVVPQLVSCIQLIIDQIPAFADQVVDWAKKLGFLEPETIQQLEKIDWPARLTELAGVVTSGIGSVAEVVISTVSSVFSGVVTTLLSIIFAVYVLLNKDKLYRSYHAVAGRYMKKSWMKKIDYVADVLHQSFRRYIVGQCTEAVVLGVLCMLGMWILRLPYASMIGALVAFTALVPVVGAFVGGGIGAFMILMVSPVQALIFVVFLVILQQLENNLIYPKVVGTSLGLPPIWVLAAVTVGGGVLGVGGMLLGVPLTAAIYRIIREDVYKDRPEEKPEEKPEE